MIYRTDINCIDKCMFNHVKVMLVNAVKINWADINCADKCAFNHIKIIYRLMRRNKR